MSSPSNPNNPVRNPIPQGDLTPAVTPMLNFTLAGGQPQDVQQNWWTLDLWLQYIQTLTITNNTAISNALQAIQALPPVVLAAATAALDLALPQIGVAVCTGNGPTITFGRAYVGTLAPVVIVTQIGTTPNGLSTSITMIGTAGAWTGFTLNLSGSFFGAYSWLATGNPN